MLIMTSFSRKCRSSEEVSASLHCYAAALDLDVEAFFDIALRRETFSDRVFNVRQCFLEWHLGSCTREDHRTKRQSLHRIPQVRPGISRPSLYVILLFASIYAFRRSTNGNWQLRRQSRAREESRCRNSEHYSNSIVLDGGLLHSVRT